MGSEASPLPHAGPDGQRVLILPPTTRDGHAIEKLLQENALPCLLCASIDELCKETVRGAGVIVISEEAVTAHFEVLAPCLNGTDVWSDLPLLVLSSAGSESPRLRMALEPLGNVSVIERPMRLTTFLTLIRSALRARQRQYEVRDHLAELAHAAHSLREGEQRYRLLVDNIKDYAIFLIDLDGNISSWNAGAEAVFRYTSQEVLGTSAAMLFTDEDRAARVPESEMAKARENGRADDIRWHLRKDGERFYADGVLTAVRDESGTLRGYSNLMRDVTERIRAEQSVAVSNARFKALFDGINDGFCIIQIIFDKSGQPADYRYLEANPAFSELTGLNNAIGKTALELMPDLEKNWVALYGRVALTGEPVRIENYAKPLQRWFDVYAFSFAQPENQQVAVFFRDISARKQIEAALASARQKVEASLLAGEVGTYYWDILNDRVSGDRNFVAMFGVLDNESGSSPINRFLDAIHPDDLPDVSARIEATLARDEPYQTEYRVRAGNGFRWVIARGRVDRDENKKPIGWAGVIVDISSRKKVEQERQALLESESAARAEAERISRLKDEFLATLSHELRTPLNAILGWSHIMQNSRDAKDFENGMKVIERNARAQSQIIEDLLDMSRIISGKVRLDVQRLDLAAIVQAAVETARPTADAKGVRLQSVIDPLHSVLISGDSNRLQQIMWNLLTNAIKFTPKGGRVQVLLQRVNSHIEVSVIDTGEGITPEFLPYVFDRFRQADASTTRRHGGLGLGLSIVKQLVELHGGSISAKSDGKGMGTSFNINLPLTILQSETDEAETRRHPLRKPQLDGLSDPCIGVQGLQLLVVDDEPDARNLVNRLLSDCGAIVTTANSAQEAFNALKAQRFDVLISDIGMPGENGYALIARVRALTKEQGGDIPAIALTAYARAEDRVHAIASGFQMHIAKPVEPIELITMIAGAAGRIKSTSINPSADGGGADKTV